MEINEEFMKNVKEIAKKISTMSETERKEYIKKQPIIETNEPIPTLNMPIEEFCAKYGYVDMDEFMNNLE